MYDLVIHGSGTVQFHGAYFVAALGDHTAKVSQGAITDILAAAIEIRFFEMEDEYNHEIEYRLTRAGEIERGESMCTDFPLTVFEMKVGKTAKTIQAYLGYPKRLVWFRELIEDLAGIKHWIGPEEGVSDLAD